MNYIYRDRRIVNTTKMYVQITIQHTIDERVNIIRCIHARDSYDNREKSTNYFFKLISRKTLISRQTLGSQYFSAKLLVSFQALSENDKICRVPSPLQVLIAVALHWKLRCS